MKFEKNIPAFVVAISILVGNGRVYAQNSCENQFPVEITKTSSQPIVPYFRMKAMVAGVSRRITFVNPKDMDEYRKRVSDDNPIQIIFDNKSNSTVSEKLNAVTGRILQVFSLMKNIKQKTRKEIRSDYQGDSLSSAQIKEIAQEFKSKGIDLGEGADHTIRIGNRKYEGDVFLEMVKQAEKNNFVMYDIASQINSTSTGEAANAMVSVQQVFKRWGLVLAEVGLFGAVFSRSSEMHDVYPLMVEVGVATIAKITIVSAIGSVGRIFSHKLAFILPNVSGLISGEAGSRALSLNAARDAMNTISDLIEKQPDAQDILIITDNEKFRVELRQRLGI